MIDREYVKLNTSIQTASNAQQLLHDAEGNPEATIELRLPDSLFTENTEARKIEKVEMLTSKFRLSMQETPIAQVPLDMNLTSDTVKASTCQLDVYPFCVLDDNKLTPNPTASNFSDQSFAFPWYKDHKMMMWVTVSSEAVGLDNERVAQYEFYANSQGFGFPTDSRFYDVVKNAGLLTKQQHMMNLCAQSNHEAYNIDGTDLFVKSIGTLEQMLQDALENAITYACTRDLVIGTVHLIDERDITSTTDPKPDRNNYVDLEEYGVRACFWYYEVHTGEGPYGECNLLMACKPTVKITEQSLSISYDTGAFGNTVPILWNTPYVNTYDRPEQLTNDVDRRRVGGDEWWGYELWNKPPPKRVYSYGVQTEGDDPNFTTYNFALYQPYNCAVMNIIANQAMKDTFSFLPWIKVDMSTMDEFKQQQWLRKIEQIKNVTDTTIVTTTVPVYRTPSGDHNITVRPLRRANTQQPMLRMSFYYRFTGLPGGDDIPTDGNIFDAYLVAGGTSAPQDITMNYLCIDGTDKTTETTTKSSPYSTDVFYSNDTTQYQPGTTTDEYSDQHDEDKYYRVLSENITFDFSSMARYQASSSSSWVDGYIIAYFNSELNTFQIGRLIPGTWSDGWGGTREYAYLPCWKPDNYEQTPDPNDPTLYYCEATWNIEGIDLNRTWGMSVRSPSQNLNLVGYSYENWGYINSTTITRTVTALSESDNVEKSMMYLPNLETENNVFYVLDGTPAVVTIGSQEVCQCEPTAPFKAVDSQTITVEQSPDGDPVTKEYTCGGVNPATHEPLSYTMQFGQASGYSTTLPDSTELSNVVLYTYIRRYSGSMLSYSREQQKIYYGDVSNIQNVQMPPELINEVVPHLEEISSERTTTRYPSYDTTVEDGDTKTNINVSTNDEYLNEEVTSLEKDATYLIDGEWVEGAVPAIGSFATTIHSPPSSTPTGTYSVTHAGDYVEYWEWWTLDLSSDRNVKLLQGVQNAVISYKRTQTTTEHDITYSAETPLYYGNVRLTFTWNNLPMVVMSPIASIVMTLIGMQSTQEVQPVNIQQPTGSSLVANIPIIENYYSLATTLRDLHDELVVIKETFDDMATYQLGTKSGQERTLQLSAKFITKDGKLHQIYIPKNGVFSLQLTFGLSFYHT